MAKLITNSSLGTPADTYLFALAHTPTCLGTIASDDTLRLFDPALQATVHFQSHNSGLTCLQPFDASSFATAGRDGIIRLFDARARQSTSLSEPQRRPLSALACHGPVIAVGTDSLKEGLEDVSVLLFDTRSPSSPLRNYAESHTDAITQLAFHPAQSHILLSGSTDGLCSLFDLNHAEEDDALQQVLNPRAAVHCAGFLPNDQAYVFTTDEQCFIYSLNDELTDQASHQTLGDVREPLGCMYVINLLEQADGQRVVAHGHNERRQLALTQFNTSSAKSWSFGQTVQLPGAHGEDVVRDVLLTAQRAYSCGEDGQVRLWQWS